VSTSVASIKPVRSLERISLLRVWLVSGEPAPLTGASSVKVLMSVHTASPSNPKELVNVKDCPKETVLTLASAHALVLLDDGMIVGDPMERTTLEALEWKITKGGFCHLAFGHHLL
jgi:hypothetical protein